NCGVGVGGHHGRARDSLSAAASYLYAKQLFQVRPFLAYLSSPKEPRLLLRVGGDIAELSILIGSLRRVGDAAKVETRVPAPPPSRWAALCWCIHGHGHIRSTGGTDHQRSEGHRRNEATRQGRSSPMPDFARWMHAIWHAVGVPIGIWKM